MSTMDVTYTAPIVNAPALSLSAILGDLYTLRSAGAALNGTFNDQGTSFKGIDDTAAVQALFSAAGSSTNPPIGLSADWQGGNNSNNTPQREVNFPRGSVFLVRGTISVPPGVRVRGNSSVVLQLDTTMGVPTFNCQFDSTVSPSLEAYSGNSFHNLLVWGGAPGVSNNTGIRMGACQDFSLDDCIIAGFRVGVDLWSCQYADIQNSQIEYNVHNVIFRNYPTTAGHGTGGSAPTIDFRMQNSRASSSVGGYGVWLQNATNVVIDQIDTNFCDHAALVCGGALPDYVSRTLAFTPRSRV